MVGIYKITNKINNKVYIGESQNIERRWEEHKKHLKEGKHHSYKLQQDYHLYGEDNFEYGFKNFEFLILETSEDADYLDKKKKEIMNQFQRDKIYNTF
jgi:group I intron endonuclease